MRICILCEVSKLSQVREKMKNDNILNIDLSPTGELPATHSGAGNNACGSSDSNFIGANAGEFACNSSNSNFIGCGAGYLHLTRL